MIVLIDDDSITAAPDAGVFGAVSDLMAAMRLGHHRLLISPAARAKLEESQPALKSMAGWSIIESTWLEGQAIARSLSRIIALTDDPARSGTIIANRFHVHFNEIDAKGIAREPSFVMENMATDARLIKAYMPILLQLEPAQLKRLWSAKPEQGGGNTTATYVDRHTAEPTPISLIVDRDGPGVPSVGTTADTCLKKMVAQGVFATKADALAGGFSPSRPNISLHTMSAWAIENLIFPKLMELFFVHIAPANGHGDTARRAPLVNLFPNFPELTDEEADAWLVTKFKKSPMFGNKNIFDSGCIIRLLDWAQSDGANSDHFNQALLSSLSTGPFKSALRDAVRDLWSIGHRYKAVA